MIKFTKSLGKSGSNKKRNTKRRNKKNAKKNPLLFMMAPVNTSKYLIKNNSTPFNYEDAIDIVPSSYILLDDNDSERSFIDVNEYMQGSNESTNEESQNSSTQNLKFSISFPKG